MDYYEIAVFWGIARLQAGWVIKTWRAWPGISVKISVPTVMGMHACPPLSFFIHVLFLLGCRLTRSKCWLFQGTVWRGGPVSGSRPVPRPSAYPPLAAWGLLTLVLVSAGEQRAIWLLWLGSAGQLLQGLRNSPWEPGRTWNCHFTDSQETSLGSHKERGE